MDRIARHDPDLICGSHMAAHNRTNGSNTKGFLWELRGRQAGRSSIIRVSLTVKLDRERFARQAWHGLQGGCLCLVLLGNTH